MNYRWSLLDCGALLVEAHNILDDTMELFNRWIPSSHSIRKIYVNAMMPSILWFI